MTEEVMSATDASRGFSELLHRVCYGGESFVIKKGNRIMARITPVEVEQKAETELTAQAAVSGLIFDEPLPENVTEEEAEYFKSVLEQIRKIPA